MPSTEEKKKRLRKKFKTISAILKLFVLLIILIGVPLYIYFFQYDIIEQFSTLEQVEAFFREYKTQSIFIYIALRIIQIIIASFPDKRSICSRIHVRILDGISVVLCGSISSVQ